MNFFLFPPKNPNPLRPTYTSIVHTYTPVFACIGIIMGVYDYKTKKKNWKVNIRTHRSYIPVFTCIMIWYRYFEFIFYPDMVAIFAIAAPFNLLLFYPWVPYNQSENLVIVVYIYVGLYFSDATAKTDYRNPTLENRAGFQYSDQAFFFKPGILTPSPRVLPSRLICQGIYFVFTPSFKLKNKSVPSLRILWPWWWDNTSLALPNEWMSWTPYNPFRTEKTYPTLFPSRFVPKNRRAGS